MKPKNSSLDTRATYPADASAWMTWCRCGSVPWKKQVARIWWGSTGDEFKFPVCLWTLDYVQLQSMQFYIRICVQNQNAKKLMKIHNKYKKSGSGGSAEACFSSIAGLYQTFPSDSQDQAPDRKMQSKIYSNIKQKLEDTKDTSQTSELLHHFKSGSSDLHVPKKQPPKAAAWCVTRRLLQPWQRGIPRNPGWYLQGVIIWHQPKQYTIVRPIPQNWPIDLLLVWPHQNGSFNDPCPKQYIITGPVEQGGGRISST